MDNALKTPLGRSINRIATKKAQDLINILGRSLPASVVSVVSSGIVTVRFEITSPFTISNVTMPMVGAEYVRLPIQPGCKGWVIPSDAYLGGMSGLGGGVADLTPRATLAALVWSPIGNTAWDPSEDPNAVVLYGPNGVIMRDQGKNSLVSVDAGGNAVVHGLKSFAWDVNGYGTKVTYNGGIAFTVDNYTTGATVTTNTHAWTPPGPL